MKLEDIKVVRVFKLLQLVFYFIGMYYLVTKEIKLAVLFLLISFLIELILPTKYGWGLVKNRQNLFFNSNDWVEPVFFFCIIVGGTGLITYLFYQ